MKSYRGHLDYHNLNITGAQCMRSAYRVMNRGAGALSRYMVTAWDASPMRQNIPLVDLVALSPKIG